MRLVRIIVNFWLLLSPLFAWGTTGNFFTITDIHFDPFDTCESKKSVCSLVVKLKTASVGQWRQLFERYELKALSTYGQDTNYALLKSSLNELKTLEIQKQPSFVLLIGDYLAHHYRDKYVLYSGDSSLDGYQSFVQKTMQFLTNELHATFPDTPVYLAIGNNDSYRGDYYSDPDGEFYSNMANLWSIFFMNASNKVAFLKSFPYAGYYAIAPPKSPNDRILILNSVLFSVKAHGPNVSIAAHEELKWLQKNLSQALLKHQRVWLVFHIPFGVDVYETFISGKLTSLWQPLYLNRFLFLMSQYASVVQGVFTSHLHMDGFSIVRNLLHKDIFDSYVPAISSQFGNNPAFKVYKYDLSGFDVTDFSTYYLYNPTQRWQLLYKFNETYQPQCKRCILINGMKKLQKNNDIAKFYKEYYAAGSNRQPIEKDPNSWPYYWCAIHNFKVSKYKACLSESSSRGKSKTLYRVKS